MELAHEGIDISALLVVVRGVEALPYQLIYQQALPDPLCTLRSCYTQSPLRALNVCLVGLYVFHEPVHLPERQHIPGPHLGQTLHSILVAMPQEAQATAQHELRALYRVAQQCMRR